MIHVFRSKIFCRTLPKNIVGEPFCAVFQKISGFDEIYGGEGGGVPGYPVEKFLSHSAKENVGEPISVSLLLGIDKFYASEGQITVFCRKIFFSQCRKLP